MFHGVPHGLSRELSHHLPHGLYPIMPGGFAWWVMAYMSGGLWHICLEGYDIGIWL